MDRLNQLVSSLLLGVELEKKKRKTATSVTVGRGVKQIEFLGKMCPNNSI
jgi:hypothetical protein